ncbi:MAG TPA: hypothetical protein VG253_11010 [Streptosporangiaceae bacterium]|nr:hypothetical protein [Streptosporangiaceae bacterium]
MDVAAEARDAVNHCAGFAAAREHVGSAATCGPGGPASPDEEANA